MYRDCVCHSDKPFTSIPFNSLIHTNSISRPTSKHIVSLLWIKDHVSVCPVDSFQSWTNTNWKRHTLTHTKKKKKHTHSKTRCQTLKKHIWFFLLQMVVFVKNHQVGCRLEVRSTGLKRSQEPMLRPHASGSFNKRGLQPAVSVVVGRWKFYEWNLEGQDVVFFKSLNKREKKRKEEWHSERWRPQNIYVSMC